MVAKSAAYDEAKLIGQFCACGSRPYGLGDHFRDSLNGSAKWPKSAIPEDISFLLMLAVASGLERFPSVSGQVHARDETGGWGR